MVSLIEIKLALDGIQKESGDDCKKYVDEAIERLKTAQEALNTISVRGRHDVDALLRCMLGIDLIIGEDNNGR
jgi:gamma-glutamyl phosphate reductase